MSLLLPLWLGGSVSGGSSATVFSTTADAREAMYELFSAVWSPNVLTFDNEAFDPPESAPWARFAVRHTDGGGETLGAAGERRFMRSGIAVAQLFVRADTGLSTMDGLIETARNAFEGARIIGTTVRFYDVATREIGVDDKWYQVNIEASFEYDDKR